MRNYLTFMIGAALCSFLGKNRRWIIPLLRGVRGVLFYPLVNNTQHAWAILLPVTIPGDKQKELYSAICAGYRQCTSFFVIIVQLFYLFLQSQRSVSGQAEGPTVCTQWFDSYFENIFQLSL